MGISFFDDAGNNVEMSFEEHDEYMRPARLMWEENCWAQRINSDLAFEQFIRDNVEFYETDDIIMFIVDPEFRFEVGQQYMRLDGKIVTVVERTTECFRCNDGEEAVEAVLARRAKWQLEDDDSEPIIAEKLGWRYDRGSDRGDLGRCTGSQWSYPRNIIPLDLTKLKKVV